MTFDVEIVLRERNYAVTERLEPPGRRASWTERDVAEVLKSILLGDRSREEPGRRPNASSRCAASAGSSSRRRRAS